MAIQRKTDSMSCNQPPVMTPVAPICAPDRGYLIGIIRHFTEGELGLDLQVAAAREGSEMRSAFYK
jgi:hypothetical protein